MPTQHNTSLPSLWPGLAWEIEHRAALFQSHGFDTHQQNILCIDCDLAIIKISTLDIARIR